MVRNGPEILHQCGKSVKTKSQKILAANSYVCRRYREKSSRGAFLALSILNRVNDRVQVAKVGSYCSEILDIISGVPQGSILGLLLSSINIIALFLIEHYRSHISNYADDTTTYNCGDTFLEAISDLETTIENLFDSFCCNNFKVNSSTCHLFLSLFNFKPININNSSIEGSSSEKLITVTFDSNFIFEKHEYW